MNPAARAIKRLSQSNLPALLHSSPQPQTTHLPPVLSAHPSQHPHPLNLSPQSTSSLHTTSLLENKDAAAYTSPEGSLQTLTLPTSRKITYRCYGPPSGKPMFYFHGTPSGACESVAFKSFIHPRDIFVIGTNRPGFGQSDPQSGRTISDHAYDVLAIADSLGIEKFRVMGASGGGPYVLACANVIPKDRLIGAAVVAGVTPWEFGRKGMYFQGRLRFFLVKYLSNYMFPIARREFEKNQRGKTQEELEEYFKKTLKSVTIGLGAKDKAAFEKEEMLKEGVETFMEAYENGPEGGFEDSKLILDDWGFRLEDIPYEGIKLYYGTMDRNTPVSPAKEMLRRLKKATWMDFEGEGHFSVFDNRGGDIFDDFFKE
ncbi:hypothetical protein ABW19_dt0205238 [Dactylella cylindrospora]|nr:hypothetical protein ABW19_dt0205238 [Dactylella cylindrospora]